MRRLTDQATYLYVDGQRYGYSLQPDLTRLAHDRTQSETFVWLLTAATPGRPHRRSTANRGGRTPSPCGCRMTNSPSPPLEESVAR